MAIENREDAQNPKHRSLLRRGEKRSMATMINDRRARDAIFMNSFVVFYRRSWRTGISPMKERAIVSESTSNEAPESKDDLIRAFLEDRHAIWVRWFQHEISARYETTGGGLEIIADVLREWFEGSQMRCCAVTDVIPSNRRFDVQNLEPVRNPKGLLRLFVEQLAVKIGLQCPDIAASAVVLIVERAIAMNLATGDLSELKTTRLLLECLQHALWVGFN